MLVADLKEVINNLAEDEQYPQIPIEIMDNELAKVYANSIKGEVFWFSYNCFNFLIFLI